MTPEDIEENREAEAKRMEEAVMDEVQEVEDEAGHLIDRLTEERKKYEDMTGWPPV